MVSEVLNRLDDSWDGINEIIVYGFGKVAQRNIDKLCRDFSIKYIIDNKKGAECTGGQYYNNILITTLNNVQKDVCLKRIKVVVCTSSLAYSCIKNSLDNLGLCEYKDYCRLSDFMIEWYWRYKRQVVLSQMSVSVTSRCTLNCRHCNVFMPYYKKHYDRTTKEVISDLELLFKHVDYLTSYFIFGGEPLLNNELPEMIENIYERFCQKIGYMQIISNGTILPDDKLLLVCRKCNVKIRLSDYTKHVSYEKRLEAVKEKLTEYGVDWSMGIYDTWLSLLFPEVIKPIGKTPEEAKKHMLTCSQGCHMIGDGKLYYCGALHSVDKGNLYKLHKGDYIDLKVSTGNIDDDKLKVLKYCLGELQDKEYISFCNICYGAGPDNPYNVIAGEQLKINE